MFVMSSSMILSNNLIYNCCKLSPNSCFSSNHSKFVVRLNSIRRRRFCGLVPYVKKNSRNLKKPWWQRFFSVEEANWFGLKDDGVLEGELQNMKDEEVPEEEKFEAWKRRAEAIMELREAHVDMRNEESRQWEDWLVDDVDSNSSWEHDWDDRVEESREDVFPRLCEIEPEKGLAELARNVIFGRENDDILYEDRVFRYASLNSETRRRVHQKSCPNHHHPHTHKSDFSIKQGEFNDSHNIQIRIHHSIILNNSATIQQLPQNRFLSKSV